MAKIYQKRGRWCVDYTGADGKRHRVRMALGTSKTLAKEILLKKQAEATERKYFPGRVENNRPFSVLAELYQRLHGVKIAKVWLRMLVNDIRPALGDKKIVSITAADLQIYYNKIAERASPATANRHLSLIRSIFNRGKAWGEFYGSNPCSGVNRGRENPHRLRYLSTEEMKRLLAAAHPRIYPVVVCALLTGMRKMEILSLDWRNVDLKRGVIYLLKTKSGKPREVPVTAKLNDVFSALGPREVGSVFNVSLDALRYSFGEALTAAKITSFRFHDLRHTFASHFIMRTNDLPALQNILGHSTPTMTLRYAHLSRPHLTSELAIFEAVVPVGEAPKRALEAVQEVAQDVLVASGPCEQR